MLGIIQSVAQRLGGSNIVQVGLAMSPGGLWSTISARSKIRCYFPKPKEVKRIKMHGWNERMSTPAGRRTIMRRILKGRHVLTH